MKADAITLGVTVFRLSMSGIHSHFHGNQKTMSFLFSNMAVLAMAVVVSWWLSGFDSRLSGQTGPDFTRRAIRCAFSLLFVEIEFYFLWQCWVAGDRSAGIMYLAMFIPLLLTWVGCITEAGAQCFQHMIDPEDKRPYDPKTGVRELDIIGDLIRTGRKEEAIQLCKTLLRTAPEHRSAMELTLHHLGEPPQELPGESRPLVEAKRLRQTGKFREAEAILTSLLKQEPSNVNAALMLFRLYGQEMRQTDKASGVLRTLENRPYVPAAYIEFARHSLADWQTEATAAPPVNTVHEETVPESVDELIAKKFLGTAIDVLERQCEAEPGNFDNWLKLTEVHGKHCMNRKLAEKTIRQIEANSAFNAEQKQQARNRLREWRRQ
ncbi:MAG TPA: tetratricopeptide repeat protein [Verrucomicrobiae bacterium]|nr:tetratricopeptide repeat protein [Verrucomicrobiae bacterium]